MYALILLLACDRVDAPSTPASPPIPAAGTAAPDPARGAAAFATHCAACHGDGGEGGVGPTLAGRTPDLATLRAQVRAGAPPMPAFLATDLPDAAVADVHAWLATRAAPGVLPPPNPDRIDTVAGVDVERIAAGLPFPVAVTVDAGGVVWVSVNGAMYPRTAARSGAVGRIRDGAFEPVVTDLDRPLGLIWVGDTLVISERGRVIAVRDGARRTLVDGLPAQGLHQNNQLALGPDGKIYLGIGTQTNADPDGEDPLNGTIVRFGLDGGPPEVFATGFRNPFDLAFVGDTLFATDNGVDPGGRTSKLPQDAPEELNRVRPGAFFGHPWVFGETARADRPAPADLPVPVPPFVRLAPHASANGLAAGARLPGATGRLITAEFGSYLAGYRQAGRRLTAIDPATGAVQTWASGFPGRPVDVAVGPAGDLYVTDIESGVLWRLFASDRARPRFQPGFDCDRAGSLVEHALCDEPGLARLDVALNEAFAARRTAAAEADRPALKDAQRAWLTRRDACAADPWPVECLRREMSARIETLRDPGRDPGYSPPR